MKTYKNSALSICISIIGLVLLLRNNYNLSVIYLSSKGKTRALFGVLETLNYYLKYYILVIAAISLVIAIWAIRKNEDRRVVYIAIALAIVTVILVFVPLWRIMI